MNSNASFHGHVSGPTIFSHDSDEQVLNWLRHSQSMVQVEGRWQGTWQLFASEAQHECERRKLLVQAA